MAAGNWRTGAGLGDANISVARRTIAAALNSSIKNNAIIGHPVIQAMLRADEGLGPLIGELGVSEGILTIGQGTMASTAEGTDASLTNYSLSNTTTITPARRVYARAASDFGRAVQEPLLTGELSPGAEAMVAYEAYQTWVNSVVAVLVALFASLTNEIGTTGVALTWSAVQNGIIDHKDAGNMGPALALLNAKGAKDLSANMLSLSGAVQWAPQAQEAIANAVNGAYLGTFWGVQFYLNGNIANDGTDYHGGIITAGCLQTKHKIVPLPREAIQIADAGWVTVEARRTGGSETRFDMVSHFAAQIREQGRGRMIRYVM